MFTKRTMRAVGDPDLEQGLGGGGELFCCCCCCFPSQLFFLARFFFSFFTQNKGGQTPPLDPPLSYLCFPLITTLVLLSSDNCPVKQFHSWLWPINILCWLTKAREIQEFTCHPQGFVQPRGTCHSLSQREKKSWKKGDWH